jgi:hypothetical protein
MKEVTFKDLAKLASKRGLTPEYLAERFTNKIERPSEFFHRVFQSRFDKSTAQAQEMKSGALRVL